MIILKRNFQKISILVAIVLGISILGTTSWKNAQKKLIQIHADPTNSITLDEDTMNQFHLPKVATVLQEPDLLANSSFIKFVQGSNKKELLTKLKYTSIQDSLGTEKYYDSIIIPDNRIMATGIERGYNEQNKKNFSNVFISILDDVGNELVRTYVTKDYSGNELSEKSYEAGANLSILANGNVRMWYKNYDYHLSVLDINPQNALIMTDQTLDKETEHVKRLGYNPMWNEIAVDGENTWLISSQKNSDYNNEIGEVNANKLFVGKVTTDKKTISKIYSYQRPDFEKIAPDFMANSENYYKLGADFTRKSKGSAGIIEMVSHDYSIKDESKRVLVVWDKNGEIHEQLVGDWKEQKKLRQGDMYFVTKKDTDATRLYSYNLADPEITKTLIKEFPKETDISLDRNGNGSIIFYGTMTTYTNDFSGLATGKSNVLGKLKETTYELLNFSQLREESVITMNRVHHLLEKTIILGSIKNESDNIQISGNLRGKAKADTSYTNKFIGTIGYKERFDPVINAKEALVLNMDQTTRQERNDHILTSISVHDTAVFDSKNVSGQKSMEWLRARIDLNPLSINYDDTGETIINNPEIDFKKLGYTDGVIGPQRFTHFISSDSLQLSATTQIVSTITNKTKENNNAMLDAHNFSILLKDIETKADSDIQIKKMAKTVAWEKNTGELIEESIKSIVNSKIFFPKQAQIEAIKNATEAKPYPLDIQYKGSDTVINRIWVFVVNENTTVANNIVLYADEITLTLSESIAATENSLLKKTKMSPTHPNVIVYDYLDQPQDQETLTAITQGNNDGVTKGLSIDDESFLNLVSTEENKKISDFKINYNNPKDNKKTTVTTSIRIEDDSLISANELRSNFSFKLERNEEELRIIEPVLNKTMSNKYKSLEIRLPLNQSFKSWETLSLPDKWFKYKNSDTDTYQSFGFSVVGNNDVVTIRNFIETVRFTINNFVDKPEQVEIIFRERVYTSFEHPDRTIHHYTFIEGMDTWLNSYNSAKKQTYKGLTGYLATITSLKEHDLIYDNIAKKPGWLGGSRLLKSNDKQIIDDEKLTNNISEYNKSITTANKWYWVNGPEKGRYFYNTPTASPQGAIANTYNGFSGMEPNNKFKEEGEYVLQFAMDNSKSWNDLANHPNDNMQRWTQGYYVEFSEYNGQIETEYDEFDIYYKTDVPQKIYISGKDEKGKSLILGNQVLEKQLTLEKKIPFVSINIPKYNYIKLMSSDGEEVSPENLEVKAVKQEFSAIYKYELSKLHLRQVIINPVIELVTPLRGEGTLKNINKLNEDDVYGNYPVIYPTIQESINEFKTISYEINEENSDYTITPILPQYYSYAGHVITQTNIVHLSENRHQGKPEWDGLKESEVFVTLYLIPNDSGGREPGLYGWNYGKDQPYTLIP